jgi:1,2-dihydroxy-3-keto-5-methylthiopentene dioxygenase
MTFLLQMNEDARAVHRTSDRAEIAATLARAGALYQHRAAPAGELEGLSESALGEGLARLRDALPVTHGHRFDHERLDARAADAAALERIAADRRHYGREHTHAHDEMWYFMEGHAAFYLRLGGHVHALVCGRGDFLSVPSGTRHWFDAGARPYYDGLHFVMTTGGFTGQFTGDQIALRFPGIETVMDAGSAGALP